AANVVGYSGRYLGDAIPFLPATPTSSTIPSDPALWVSSVASRSGYLGSAELQELALGVYPGTLSGHQGNSAARVVHRPTGGPGGSGGTGATDPNLVALEHKLYQFDSEGRVLVHVRGTPNANLKSLSDSLQNLGMNVVGTFANQVMVSG